MALEDEIAQQQTEPATSIFDGLYPQKNASTLTTNDMSNANHYLSPGEQEAYDQYQQQMQSMPQGHGALNMHDYYPGFQNAGAVGNYSGSVVGNVALFGGGGALVPIGMMDARDAALTKASLQKQKEVDDWRKQFKAPTSKLTNINEGLTNEYYKFHQDSWNKALKKSNGNPNLAKQYLQNDPDFLAKDKSYQNLALDGDAVAGKIADIEHRHKAGDVLSPALLEAKNRVLMDMNPDSPNFKHLKNSIMRMDADREFSDAANEALMRAVTNETGQVFDRSNADQMRVYKKSVEELSPETKQAVIEGLKKVYDGSTMYSPEYIERNASGLMNYKKTKEDLHLSQKREEEPDTDVKDIANEEDRISGNVLETGGTMREGKYHSSDRLTFKKPIKVVIPVGTKAVNLKAGGIPDKNKENVEAEIGGVYNTYTYGSTGDKDKGFDGMMIDEEGMKNPSIKKNAKMTPMVSVRYKTKNAEGDDEIVSTQVPLASVKNALIGKKGQNKKVFDEIEKRASEKSEGMKEKKPAATSTSKKKNDPLGLF